MVSTLFSNQFISFIINCSYLFLGILLTQFNFIMEINTNRKNTIFVYYLSITKLTLKIIKLFILFYKSITIFTCSCILIQLKINLIHCNKRIYLSLELLLVVLVIFFFTRNNNWCNIANRQFYFLIVLIRYLILIFIPYLEFIFYFLLLKRLRILFFRERGYAQLLNYDSG